MLFQILALPLIFGELTVISQYLSLLYNEQGEKKKRKQADQLGCYKRKQKFLEKQSTKQIKKTLSLQSISIVLMFFQVIKVKFIMLSFFFLLHCTENVFLHQ